MIWQFWTDIRGNFSAITTIALVPIMGALALAVDSAQLARQQRVTTDALEAAGVAAARRLAEGATDDQAVAYAKGFFAANLNDVDPNDTSMTVRILERDEGGSTLKVSAKLTLKPTFLPAHFFDPLAIDAQANQTERLGVGPARKPLLKQLRGSRALSRRNALFGDRETP